MVKRVTGFGKNLRPTWRTYGVPSPCSFGNPTRKHLRPLKTTGLQTFLPPWIVNPRRTGSNPPNSTTLREPGGSVDEEKARPTPEGPRHRAKPPPQNGRSGPP